MNNPIPSLRLIVRRAVRLATRLPGMLALSQAAAGLTLAAPTPAPLVQAAPAMASGAGVTLAVWQDSRDGACSDIYGACLDSAGQVLKRFAIAVAPGSQAQPAVACNGTGHLVVWTDGRSGTKCAVYAARITSAGAVSDANGLLLNATARDQ
jgi:hypothetical protein